MPLIKLTSILCECPEESDKDEIYLKFGDQKIWPIGKKFIKIDTDEELVIGLKTKVTKIGWMTIELWEYDLTSSNDHLGTFHLEINSDEPETKTTILSRNEDFSQKASYMLNWEVLG
ncbi:MAG: hypothetical protein RIA69_18000 [Cyclobacteriaceae bacterium]